MSPRSFAFFLGLCVLAPPPGAMGQGVSSEWEVAQLAASLNSQVARMKPVLEQLRPAEWVKNGAGSGYVTQHDAARRYIDYVGISSKTLAERPDKLSSVLDTFFRLQALEAAILSLNEGVRKYQNPAVAEVLSSVMSQSAEARGKLQQYAIELAAQKEQEFKIADMEAQRCRAAIAKQPPAPPAVKPAAPAKK